MAPRIVLHPAVQDASSLYRLLLPAEHIPNAVVDYDQCRASAVHVPQDGSGEARV